jgi:hypothetical protein
VPVLAVDPVAGGAKVRRQAESLGWPVIFNVDAVKDPDLDEAFHYCLAAGARTKARQCMDAAIERLEGLRGEFVTALKNWDRL